MLTPTDENLTVYPGGDLVSAGLKDLRNQVCSEAALLVSIASTRLRDLGFEVPGLAGIEGLYEHALYASLQDRLGDGAHSAYNALIGRIVSFAQAYEHMHPTGGNHA